MRFGAGRALAFLFVLFGLRLLFHLLQHFLVLLFDVRVLENLQHGEQVLQGQILQRVHLVDSLLGLLHFVGTQALSDPVFEFRDEELVLDRLDLVFSFRLVGVVVFLGHAENGDRLFDDGGRRAGAEHLADTLVRNLVVVEHHVFEEFTLGLLEVVQVNVVDLFQFFLELGVLAHRLAYIAGGLLLAHGIGELSRYTSFRFGLEGHALRGLFGGDPPRAQCHVLIQLYLHRLLVLSCRITRGLLLSVWITQFLLLLLFSSGLFLLEVNLRQVTVDAHLDVIVRVLHCLHDLDMGHPHGSILLEGLIPQHERHHDLAVVLPQVIIIGIIDPRSSERLQVILSLFTQGLQRLVLEVIRYFPGRHALGSLVGLFHIAVRRLREV